MTDCDTGKPKGYWLLQMWSSSDHICRRYDPLTSQSTQRNLNGHEIGGSALRMDFAGDSTWTFGR